MKELMTTKTFSYSELNKKYNNFLNIAGTLERRGVEVFERSKDIVNPNMTYKTSGKNGRYNSVVEALIRGRKKRSGKGLKFNLFLLLQ